MIYDVAIIGAGVIGTATAYHLKQLKPKLNIILIDKNSHVAAGNTAKSAALYRNLFSSSTSQVLASNSIKFYKNIASHISLREMGYLWTFGQDKWKSITPSLQKMNKTSLNYSLLNSRNIFNDFMREYNIKDKEMKRDSYFPPIYKGILGQSCGSLSAVGLSRYYASKFQKFGGQLKLNAKVLHPHLSGSELHYAPWKSIDLQNVELESGEKIKAQNFIFTTGAWTQEILGPLGIASQIYPKKRQLFTLEIENPSEIFSKKKENSPAIILPAGGVYLKPTPNPKKFIVGCANHLGNPFLRTQDPPEASEEYFNTVIAPVLHAYFPNLKDYKIIGKWAGYYAYYWPDGNPVIEKISNIEWVSGTSGSGIMKADSIGRIAASKILGIKKAVLFTGDRFNVDDLSLRSRNVEMEQLII